MKRREFIAATTALLVSLRRSGAQGTPHRIGYLGGTQNWAIVEVWRARLRDLGWIEGKNLIVDYRFFEGHAERIPALVAELVTLKPDLLVGSNPARKLGVALLIGPFLQSGKCKSELKPCKICAP